MKGKIGNIDWEACPMCKYNAGKYLCNAPKEVGWLDLEDFLGDDGELRCPEFKEED